MGIEYEEITLLTEDDIRIQGWYIPSTNGAALVGVHGLSGNRMHVMPTMQALTEQGVGWLLIDLRAHGENDGDVFAASRAATFFGTPLNHMHHVMIEVFSGVPAAPPIKEVIPSISPRPITFGAAGQDTLEKAIAQRYQEIAGIHQSCGSFLMLSIWVVYLRIPKNTPNA